MKTPDHEPLRACLRSGAGAASVSEFLSDVHGWRWPLLAKPVDGSSSIGIIQLDSERDLSKLPEKTEGYLIQERWSGAEFTVNMYLDSQGRLQCAIPHRRIETRTGEVSKGRTERVPELQEVARKIASSLPPSRGALCFQAIAAPDGAIAVFENSNAASAAAIRLPMRRGPGSPRGCSRSGSGCRARLPTIGVRESRCRYDARCFLLMSEFAAAAPRVLVFDLDDTLYPERDWQSAD